MKKLFENKKAVAAICVALVVVIAAVAAGITISKNKVKVEPETSAPTENVTTTKPTTTAPTTTEPTTAETTTETTTEAPSTTRAPETTRAPQTTRAPETTTRKQETTTKKQETTTKKTETTTKSEKEQALQMLYIVFGSKEAYENAVKNTAALKCEYCGKHNCPSITYIKDNAGNYSNYEINKDKCPQKPSIEYCRTCGKKMCSTSVLGNASHPVSEWCDGGCYLSVGG